MGRKRLTETERDGELGRQRGKRFTDTYLVHPEPEVVVKGTRNVPLHLGTVGAD